MVITRLRCILLFSVLLSLVSHFLAYRVAVYFLCPEPSVSLQCFDTLRVGMAEEDARAVLEPPSILWFIGGPMPDRHHAVQFHKEDVEIVLVFDDGVLIDGRAMVHGQVVRHHLEGRDPIIDTIRLGVRRLEQR